MESVVVHFRVTKKNYQKLRKVSDRKMKPMGTYVRELVERHLEG